MTSHDILKKNYVTEIILVEDETIESKLISSDTNPSLHSALVSISSTTSYSYSFWMTLKERTSGALCSLLHRGAEDSIRRPGVWLHQRDDGHFFHVRADTKTCANQGFDCSTQSIQLEQPTHIAVVFDSTDYSGSIKLYVDGVLDSNTSYYVGEFLPASGEPLYIGKDPWHSSSCVTFKDLRAFSYALSESDVKRVMDGYVNVKPTVGSTTQVISDRLS